MIYLSLGSNQGNRFLNLLRAVELIKEQNLLTNLEQSIILETEAILPENAPPDWNSKYFNMIIRGNSKYSPEAFLSLIKKIELSMGRKIDSARWAPRNIDIDILLWHNEIIDKPQLTIPHKELLNRPFLVHLLAIMDEKLVYPLSSEKNQQQKFSAISHQAKMQNSFIRSLSAKLPKLVGIVNITPDSFSDGNLYLKAEEAAKRAKELSENGAYIIELGAQSTRPGALMISKDEEKNRLAPVLEIIKAEMGYSYNLSLDSFSPDIIAWVMQNYPINMVNDVKGGSLPKNILHMIADNNKKIVVMHSLSIPPSHENCLNFDKDPIDNILFWAEEKIKELKNSGLRDQQIIIDPGIGFGKSAYQNISILRYMKEIKQRLACEIMTGHSRKSYITSFFPGQNQAQRDLETIAISQNIAYLQASDYLRLHNIDMHMRALTAINAVFS